jgi:hypothetical protein
LLKRASPKKPHGGRRDDARCFVGGIEPTGPGSDDRNGAAHSKIDAFQFLPFNA